MGTDIHGTTVASLWGQVSAVFFSLPLLVCLNSQAYGGFRWFSKHRSPLGPVDLPWARRYLLGTVLHVPRTVLQYDSPVGPPSCPAHLTSVQTRVPLLEALGSSLECSPSVRPRGSFVKLFYTLFYRLFLELFCAASPMGCPVSSPLGRRSGSLDGQIEGSIHCSLWFTGIHVHDVLSLHGLGDEHELLPVLKEISY